jgi:hypothetical protein
LWDTPKTGVLRLNNRKPTQERSVVWYPRCTRDTPRWLQLVMIGSGVSGSGVAGEGSTGAVQGFARGHPPFKWRAGIWFSQRRCAPSAPSLACDPPNMYMRDRRRWCHGMHQEHHDDRRTHLSKLTISIVDPSAAPLGALLPGQRQSYVFVPCNAGLSRARLHKCNMVNTAAPAAITAALAHAPHVRVFRNLMTFGKPLAI